ncbi:hypothetical protein JVU11DRAFT_5643 [Chiua virens]|nr:hypothetical protein JVU11DRAFT_5643 [Chiua virens]
MLMKLFLSSLASLARSVCQRSFSKADEVSNPDLVINTVIFPSSPFSITTMDIGNFAAEFHPHEPGSDTASELLIAQLVLNDIASIQASRKCKGREDAPLSNEDMALDFQAASLNGLIRVLNDYQLASSVDRAMESDAHQLRRLSLLEQAERDDHRAAVALQDGYDLPQQTAAQRTMEQTLDQPTRELQPVLQNRGRPNSATHSVADSIDIRMQNIHLTTQVTSSTGPRDSPKNPAENLECVICGDAVVVNRSFKAPCVHYYCRGCLVNLVETSLCDESLYPLRCCRQPLPLESGVFWFITLSLRQNFLDKSREYSVPAGSRVYCSNPRCSTFLGASGYFKRNLICGDCHTISCSQCKKTAHPEEDCSDQQSMMELREMATANKWQTCPGCHAIVELSQGCYHITCRCSTQFCYLCSARWRTCDCRQWDEEQLVNDADRRVRNQFGNQVAVLQPAVHAERVRQRLEVLRENHECRQHFWRYRHGSGECEQCGDFLAVFLMRCIRCQTLVCRRCSVNRL